jgi:hypothetical protein
MLSVLPSWLNVTPGLSLMELHCSNTITHMLVKAIVIIIVVITDMLSNDSEQMSLIEVLPEPFDRPGSF